MRLSFFFFLCHKYIPKRVNYSHTNYVTKLRYVDTREKKKKNLLAASILTTTLPPDQTALGTVCGVPNILLGYMHRYST